MGSSCTKLTSSHSNHVVQIISQTAAAEWFGQKVFDIPDLHLKELEFEVMIYQLKLRELVENMNCFLEISINDEQDFTFKSSESINSNNVFWRTFEKKFKYKCIYEDLLKKFLEIRLHSFDKGSNISEVKSIYKVDLYTLAIGPIHHSIELLDRKKKYVGKFSCDIIFSQIQQVELQLDELHVKFYDQYDEAYNSNFNVITYDKTYKSTKTRSRISKIDHEKNESHIDWVYNISQGHENLHIQPLEAPQLSKKQKSFHDMNQSSDLEGHLTHPPYLTFRLSMDKIRYTSLQYKVWEDKLYKIEKQQHQVHLDQIHLNLQRKNSGELQQLSDTSTERNRQHLKQNSFFGIDEKSSVSTKHLDQQIGPIRKESSAAFKKKKTFLKQEETKGQHSFKKQESSKVMVDATGYYAPTQHSPSNKKLKKFGEDSTYELKAECYIGFQKLLNDELKAFDIKDSYIFDLKLSQQQQASSNSMAKTAGRKSSAQIPEQKKNLTDPSPMGHTFQISKKKVFTEKLWYCGKQVGEINGQLTFYNLPILYQMKVGVLTKNGIFFSSRPFLLESVNNSNLKVLKDQDNPQKKMQILVDKLILSDTGKLKTRLTFWEKIQLFGELNNLLQLSHKTSMVSFIYTNESELMKCQKTMIELGQHCLTFSEYVDFELRENYYQILQQIYKRSELDLGQLGFQSINQTQKLDATMNKKKTKIAASYQFFQYSSLEMGIEKLNMKGVDVYKRSFVEIIISVSYFRVPEFREKFLDIILEKSNSHIDEWRNTEGMYLDNNNNNKDDEYHNPSIMRMFDWKSYCYDMIPQDQQEPALEILSKALASDRWKTRIQKRGVAFFLIVKQWALYVKNTLVSNNVNWKDVPGYTKILKAILLEMKERDVQFYPEALKEATCALLANEKLVNVFVMIVFNKTHAFDNQAVNNCMELIASWFTTIHKNQSILPPQFDFHFFFKGLQMLMDLDHGVSTAKCIWVLYKILHIIPMTQRGQILESLLSKKKFYDLFFHWSFNVRMLFHYFFFFQLFQHLNITNKDDATGDLVQLEKGTKSVQYYGISTSTGNQDSKLLFNQNDDQHTKIMKLQLAVQDRNAKGSLLLRNSRLYSGDGYGKIKEKFKKRKEEIVDLIHIVEKIKDYIKGNKTDLLKRKGEDEYKINEIKRAYKQSSYSSSSLNHSSIRDRKSSTTSLAPSESEDDDFTVPDERDWRKEIQDIKKRTGDFNITNYIHILTDYEKKNYESIIKKIPEDKRVYIQYALRKQFKKVKEEYEKWLEQAAKSDKEIDLPEIAVKMPRDEAETNVVQDDW